MSGISEVRIIKPNARCLIVDDSPTVRKIAGRILRNLQLEVDEANDGQVALEMCTTAMPEAILLDWNMPVMDGITFLRELRKMKGGRSPKVVFCTTETDVNHLREAFDAGADEYIMKPFDAAILQAKVLGA